ncbi:MAG: hemerythrin domain-containing protein [Dehalococcoidia bacterium]|nr:hemerythrin domain-containing protein [Dehalococcoidia bacterium]
MATLLDPIIEFRQDHRKVRDLLLGLADAVEKNQLDEARSLLAEIDAVTGPHFRYEEEALYPAMKAFLGEYVDSLVAEHDDAIRTAVTAVSLLSKTSLSEEEATGVAKAARSLLIHVSNCDGLNILAERLSPEQLESLANRYKEAREAGLSLLRWAETVRRR